MLFSSIEYKSFRLYLDGKSYYTCFIFETKADMYAFRSLLEKDGAPTKLENNYECLCTHYASRNSKYQVGCLLFPKINSVKLDYVIHEITHAVVRWWALKKKSAWKDIPKKPSINEEFVETVQHLFKQYLDKAFKSVKLIF